MDNESKIRVNHLFYKVNYDKVTLFTIKFKLMKLQKTLCFALFFCLSIASACDLDRAVRFAGNDWDSNSFSTEVARYILEKGYACKTESVRGTTAPLLNALVRGDIDIDMELWKANNAVLWHKMQKTGRVIETKGVSIESATQNFYIPRYVVFGDKKRDIKPLAPTLFRVEDMKQYYQLFPNPNNPDKGRFYNCVIGWNCEIVNNKKLNAYGLNSYYDNFRTGSGNALRSEIISALKRAQPIFFYYWGPTYLTGKYGDELLALKEPPYNPEAWRRLSRSKTGKGVKAVAYPTLTIRIAANTAFLDKAPEIANFLNKFYMKTKYVNDALVYMNEKKDLTGRQAAINFLKAHPAVWTQWLPEKQADRVKAALKQPQSSEKASIPFLMMLSSIAAIVIMTLLSFVVAKQLRNKRPFSAYFFPILILLGMGALLIFYAQLFYFSATPEQALIPIRSFVNDLIDALVSQSANFLRHSISYPVLSLVGVFQRFLIYQLSWLFITAVFTAIAYHASKRLGLTLFVFIGNLLIWAMQLWVPGIQTLLLIFIAIVLTISLGLPLGILAGLNQKLYRSISPILDVMQTMPSFVYLIPVVMLFGLGTFSGVIATAIYAIPPLIRLTAHGIRQVDSNILEAAVAFGSKRRHILSKVQLPLALPSIMVGINQAIMMALAMVVIASMIGVKGLGERVLFGLQQQNMGVGVTAGTAIVFLSIMLDRISQAYGQQLQTRFHLQGATS